VFFSGRGRDEDDEAILSGMREGDRDSDMVRERVENGGRDDEAVSC